MAFEPQGEALSVREAMGMLAPPEERAPPKQTKQPVEQAAPEEDESAPVDEADESAEEADAAAPDDEQEPRGEEEGDDTPEEAPIAPPRSLSKAEKAVFAALPREHQEVWAARERARDLDISQRQNKLAEQQKAFEAKSQEAEQARKQYEDALPQLLQVIQAQANAEFPDIKSWDDLRALAEKDPVRYNRYQVLSAQAQAVTQENEASSQRKQAELLKQFQAFTAAEAAKFLESAPEFNDPKKGPALRAEVRTYLEDAGFAPDEQKALWDGKPMSAHDHRFQTLVYKAMRFDKAQKAVKTAERPKQPAQQPGTARTKGEAQSAQLATLSQKLDRSGSRADALRLMRAQRSG